MEILIQFITSSEIISGDVSLTHNNNNMDLFREQLNYD